MERQFRQFRQCRQRPNTIICRSFYLITGGGRNRLNPRKRNPYARNYIARLTQSNYRITPQPGPAGKLQSRP